MINTYFPKNWQDYELIDSGDGEKLERFGSFTIVRPDPRILWRKTEHLKDQWEKAQQAFSAQVNSWENKDNYVWNISYNNFTFILKTKEFKNIGIFPEQAVNWDWITETINNRPLKILNLFAYTGAASVVAAKAGAIVTHVDSAKGTVEWAKENAQINSIPTDKIRWIVDDVMSFVEREIRRGSTYDGIIMDPPRFGRGNKGQVWKLNENLPKLLEASKQLLSPTASLFLINAYTADISSLVLKHMIGDLFPNNHNTIEFGELTLKESAQDRLLPSGIFARLT